ncbi:hypothetical protein [Corynebacterium aquatimens]|uniref:Or membrane protein n=1 Tax=Corynebacterium aquatimens TaxID=1190508 RepID=A0A931E1V1_9CORY|nr:hypothetical protein [Corynebacterium aquatimens]MBG6122693.1 hypothetical protein [Corynebacterium aquatimens]
MKRITAAVAAASLTMSLVVAPAYAEDTAPTPVVAVENDPTKSEMPVDDTAPTPVDMDTPGPITKEKPERGECGGGSSAKNCVPDDYEKPKDPPLWWAYSGVATISVPLFFLAIGAVGKFIYDNFFAPGAKGIGPIKPVRR